MAKLCFPFFQADGRLAYDEAAAKKSIVFSFPPFLFHQKLSLYDLLLRQTESFQFANEAPICSIMMRLEATSFRRCTNDMTVLRIRLRS